MAASNRTAMASVSRGEPRVHPRRERRPTRRNMRIFDQRGITPLQLERRAERSRVLPSEGVIKSVVDP
jgi:hypothetical protein